MEHHTPESKKICPIQFSSKGTNTYMYFSSLLLICLHPHPPTHIALSVACSYVNVFFCILDSLESLTLRIHLTLIFSYFIGRTYESPERFMPGKIPIFSIFNFAIFGFIIIRKIKS